LLYTYPRGDNQHRCLDSNIIWRVGGRTTLADNSGANSFIELMNRVRAGDQEAAARLVAEYEPQIRRVIRVKLTDSGLRRQLDSMDICQSVMGDFFVRCALGQFDLGSPGQLVKLLATMAKNRLLNHIERQQSKKRDLRRVTSFDSGMIDYADDEATASRIVAGRELLEKVRGQLTAQEALIADRRAEGRSWHEIAAELHDKPDAVRMRFSRAVQRVMKALEIESASDV
jgi:RNA polymerase sigma-70 factor (ECF subfamily)